MNRRDFTTTLATTPLLPTFAGGSPSRLVPDSDRPSHATVFDSYRLSNMSPWDLLQALGFSEEVIEDIRTCDSEYVRICLYSNGTWIAYKAPEERGYRDHKGTPRDAGMVRRLLGDLGIRPRQGCLSLGGLDLRPQESKLHVQWDIEEIDTVTNGSLWTPKWTA